MNVITRQKMLEVLYDGLRGSANVIGGKRVTGIYHKESEVAVHTADGGVYKGDLVVGADGVNSIARLDMLQAAGKSAMQEAASKLGLPVIAGIVANIVQASRRNIES